MQQEDVDAIASCGAYGTNVNHISRDLKDKFCKDLIPPEPRRVVIPCKDPKGDHAVADHTDVDMFFASDWMRALVVKAYLEFTAAFGIEKLASFWRTQDLTHPRYAGLQGRRDVRRKCIPVCLHGDGVSFQDRDSLNVLSFCGLLKEGSTLDSCFLLSAFPKSASIAGVLSTAKRIWQWIVWDFNALFRNRFQTRDPWGEPLDPDSLAFKLQGQPILPDDFYVYVFGCMADNDFHQNELGLPHQANMPPKFACHMCHAVKSMSRRNWFNFAEDSPWRSEMPRSPCSNHDICGIVGFLAWSFLLDWMHTMDLGTTAHAIGNVLYDSIYRKLIPAGRSRSQACAFVLAKMQEIPNDHGKSLERLSENDFTTHKRHLKTYPCLTHCKGAEVRYIIPGVLHVARHFADGSEESNHQIQMMEVLNEMYLTIYEAGIFLTDEQFGTLRGASLRFLRCYTWLANHAAAEDRCMYSVVPKFHYMVHLVESAKIVNPRFVWCYGGEDMVGRIARLAHMCLFGTNIQRLSLPLCERYRIAMHVRITRLGC